MQCCPRTISQYLYNISSYKRNLFTGPTGLPGPSGATGATGATGETGEKIVAFQTGKRRVARQAVGCPGKSIHRLPYSSHSACMVNEL